MRLGKSGRWNASFDEMTCSSPAICAPDAGGAGRDQDVLRAHALAGFEDSHMLAVLDSAPALDDLRLGALDVERVGGLKREISMSLLAISEDQLKLGSAPSSHNRRRPRIRRRNATRKREASWGHSRG
jgi:hypothetical protein